MVIGNQSIRDYFEKLVANDALSHAYLFYGPEGVGKKTLAVRISESIAGPSRNNPDLKIIDKESEEIHIADIRELKKFIYFTSFGKYKVVIINNAHNLGRDASNALLKVLEEPPGNSVIFLITNLPKLILPTVISRCQPIRFRPLKESDIFRHLTEEKRIKKEIALPASEMARGSLGLAIEMAGNFENLRKNINLLNKLAKADFLERFETAKKISGNSEDLKKIVRDWFVYSTSLPHPEGEPSAPYGASKKITRELLYLSNILSRSQYNHRLFLENFLIKI